jgi:hypothetical protein
MWYAILIALITYLLFKDYKRSRALRDASLVIGALADGIIKGRNSDAAAKEYVASLSNLDYRVWDRYWLAQAADAGMSVVYDDSGVTVSDATAVKITRVQMAKIDALRR